VAIRKTLDLFFVLFTKNIKKHKKAKPLTCQSAFQAVKKANTLPKAL